MDMEEAMFKVGDHVEVSFGGIWEKGIVERVFPVSLEDGWGKRWQEWQYHVIVGGIKYSVLNIMVRGSHVI